MRGDLRSIQCSRGRTIYYEDFIMKACKEMYQFTINDYHYYKYKERFKKFTIHCIHKKRKRERGREAA